MPSTLEAATALKLAKVVAITIWVANLIYVYNLIANSTAATDGSNSVTVDLILLSVAIICGVAAGLYVVATPRLALTALVILSIVFCIVWMIDTWRFILPEDSYLEHFLLRHKLAFITADKINTPFAWFEHINWWYLQPIGHVALLLVGMTYAVLPKAQARNE